MIVAFGGNLSGEYPSREALLDAAVERLSAEGIVVRRRSAWRRTTAWPDPAEPEYLNGVAIVETALGPEALMARLLSVEAAFGRRRRPEDPPNAPRTLDLDLIAYGRLRLRGPGLVLPHPRAHERSFVMGPLAEIAAGWRHPATGETAAKMAARLREADPFSSWEKVAGASASAG